MFVQQLYYLIFCISLNVLLSSARLESNCPVYIQRQAEHVSSSSAIVTTHHCIALHCIASYLHSEPIMMQIAIHSQHETLICILNQQGSLAVVQDVL